MNNLLKKINIKKYINQNILFIAFVLSSVMNGLILRTLTVKNYFDIKPLLGDFIIVTLIGSFGYLIKPKKRYIYYIIWSIIYSIICVVNSMYYTNYLSYSSISLIATSFLIVDVGDAVVENVMEIKDFCYIWQILLMTLIHIQLVKINYYEKIKKDIKLFRNTIITVFTFIIIFAISLSPTDIGRITKQWNREYIVMRYGIYTYQISDIFASVTPTINSMFGYDKNSKLFREYYKENKKKTQTNEYTNIFEGKNVLVIHAESIQQFVMDTKINGVELTPNLNKIASEGLYFSNFYAEESVGTSSDSEFTYSTSLLPATNGTVAINYWDRDYPTIQKQFKEKGYYVFSMHGNNCSFWNRNLFHQSYGYEKFYCHTEAYNIDETIGLGLSDKSFFKQSIPYLKEINETHKNWYGTMIMLTNHTPFSHITEHSDLDVTYKYEEKLEEIKDDKVVEKIVKKSYNYLEGTVLGNYFKSVHYADEALGQLMKDLEKNGLLDNTVLVIYGDHDAKIKKSEYEYYYNYDFKTGQVKDINDKDYKPVTDFDYEINRKVPFIIWSKGTTPAKEIKNVGGMIDVQPTLNNMFGMNNEYALGNDLFSVKNNIVIFPDGNWITDKMYYNSQKEEAQLIDKSFPISIDYINERNTIAEEKISVSNSIIVYDMIKSTNERMDMIKNGGKNEE